MSGLAARLTPPGAALSAVTPGTSADLAVGLALLIGGALMWARRRHERSGALMALTGATWFAGDVSGALLYAHRGPLVHLLLTYPSGRTRSRTVAAVIAAAYVDGLIPTVARSDVDDDRAHGRGRRRSPHGAIEPPSVPSAAPAPRRLRRRSPSAGR